ncbi:hypothetical protein M9458_056575, partial [Cirrhinus mrigala]
MAQLEREILQLNFEGDIVDTTKSLERNKFLLRNLLEERAQEMLVRARFLTFNSMDAPTSFFFDLEKKAVEKKILGCLKLPEGRRITDGHGIISYALSFYEDLYSAEPCDEEMAGLLLQDLPQFSEGDKSMLDKLLTFEELSAAVQEMSSGKAPGLDGLNAEFYKHFWPVIGRDLFSVFMESLNRGTLPTSLRRAVVTLLPKKGDLEDIRCWRPEKAFDRVDHGFLFKCLEAFGFGPQGCGLSGILYAIAIEPLLVALRSKLGGISTVCPSTSELITAKLSAYADDVTVVIRSAQDVMNMR